MEESIKDEENRKVCLRNKIRKLRADIAAVESKLVDGGYEFQSDILVFEPTELDERSRREKYPSANLSKLLELTAETSGFKLESCSRKLRFDSGESYLYDSILEGRTASVKFHVKFVEAVQGPGNECGEISFVEAKIIMSKGDPETLSNWISECHNAGDLAMFVHGLVEFTELANNRRVILRSLFRRAKAGHLGACSFAICTEGDGVMVIGVGPKNVNLFSINWKIEYFQAMKSTFEVNLHEKDLECESAEVFAALQRPYLTEGDLPLLWDAVADSLMSCN